MSISLHPDTRMTFRLRRLLNGANGTRMQLE